MMRTESLNEAVVGDIGHTAMVGCDQPLHDFAIGAERVGGALLVGPMSRP